MATETIKRFELALVQYIPKDPQPGTLYVAKEYGAAVHRCACGCGAKVSTPLGPTGWTLTISRNSASLTPSVGNWQLPCQSHYWITEGKVVWSTAWTPAQIEAGRRHEEERRHSYYAERRPRRRDSRLARLWRWLISLFS